MLGDAPGAEVGAWRRLECVYVPVERSDRLAQLRLGAGVFGFKTRAFVAGLSRRVRRA
jgi:hypothetical protein